MTAIPRRLKVAVAVHLFLIRDGRLLMLRRANTGFGDGLLSVPAGHLDGGETIVEAAVREAMEEIGIAVDPVDVRPVGVMHRRALKERVDFFVMAEHWTGEIRNCEPSKCAELLWADLGQIPADSVPYVGAAIRAFSRGEWFSSFGW